MNYLTENPISKYVYNKLVKLGWIVPPRSPAEIFKYVIKTRNYLRGSYKYPTFMCSSLWVAETVYDISQKEEKIAKKAIDEYMQSLGSTSSRPLSTVLLKAFPQKYNQENVWDACFEIYQDWDNRPIKENR